jgi:hypothetical protein
MLEYVKGKNNPNSRMMTIITIEEISMMKKIRLPERAQIRRKSKENRLWKRNI